MTKIQYSLKKEENTNDFYAFQAFKIYVMEVSWLCGRLVRLWLIFIVHRKLLSALDQSASNCRFARLQDNQRHPAAMILPRNWKDLEDDRMKMTQWTQISNLEVIVNSCKDPLLVRERKVCSLHLHTTKRRGRNLLRVRCRKTHSHRNNTESQEMASFSSRML